MKKIWPANHANTRKLKEARSAKLITSHLPARRAVVPRPRDEGSSREGGFLNLHRFLVRRSLGAGGFLNLRVLFGLFVMLAGIFLALLSFGPATTGFAQGTTREQITVAVAQALNIQPPACVPGQEMFHDVPASSPFCPFIEELARRGITGGCGGSNYCPSASVTRAQMAVFLLNATAGGGGVVITDPRNTAVGDQALFSNTGEDNTATGFQALFRNTAGSLNTANGAFALLNNTADANTATGAFALQANTIGGTLATVQGFDVGPNTAVGSHALESNINSSGNTTVGYQALRSMLTGLTGLPELGISTAVGFQALANVNGPDNYANDAFGYQALLDLTDGNTNVAIGTRAGRGLTTGFGNIYIGAFRPAPVATESHHTYIGNINSTSVSGAGTDSVTVDLTTGLLGHLSSSRRYKENIKPMDNASETLYRLKPVTYRYKKDVDPTQSLDYGLIAEDVANVDPNLAVRDGKGQIESVRYTAVNAMLLNEFLKEHKKVQEQQATITELKSSVAQQEKRMEILTAQLKEQAAQIQNVNAKIEMGKAAPQIVMNP